jgi:hypothetical protein
MSIPTTTPSFTILLLIYSITIVQGEGGAGSIKSSLSLSLSSLGHWGKSNFHKQASIGGELQLQNYSCQDHDPHHVKGRPFCNKYLSKDQYAAFCASFYLRTSVMGISQDAIVATIVYVYGFF